MVADQTLRNLGETLASPAETRIQLCGRLIVKIDGRRLEDELPGRQGKLLFAFLAAHRRQPVTRSQIIEALWAGNPPAAAETALSALMTKLRNVLGAKSIAGKQDVRLVLPLNAWVDLEAAAEGLHRATSAVARSEWASAWGPSRVALHISQRPVLPGFEGPWIDELRRRLADMLLRAHECVAASSIGLRGPELISAERSSRALVEMAPYRESGYRYLMEVLATQGNVGEALRIYERLRRLLRDELGASPSPELQEIHRRLLQGGTKKRDALGRELRTILFTDIVRSTELAASLGDHAWQELLLRHNAVVRAALERFGGHEIDTAGDGFLATFDEGPASAVSCACDALRGLADAGIAVRAGIHTGVCEVLYGRV